MKKSKLLALLTTFDGYEWRSFLTFLGSPYFNRKALLIRLAEELRLIINKEDLPEREVLFRRLTPGKVYQEAQFNHQLSELQALAERFLALRRF